MLERIRARFQDFIYYIRTRDKQYWNYRIAGPTRIAFLGNLILILILAYVDVIPLEMQPTFLLAWIIVQVILAAISIAAQSMTFNRTGRMAIGILVTVILLTAIGYLIVRWYISII
ncbi:MAG: hypothetical protein ACFFAY_00490 [Promethearchaeota archaeon]